jgi:hypothetical protein
LMGKSFPNSKRYSNWPILDKDKSTERNRVQCLLYDLSLARW